MATARLHVTIAILTYVCIPYRHHGFQVLGQHPDHMLLRSPPIPQTDDSRQPDHRCQPNHQLLHASVLWHGFNQTGVGIHMLGFTRFDKDFDVIHLSLYQLWFTDAPNNRYLVGFCPNSTSDRQWVRTLPLCRLLPSN